MNTLKNILLPFAAISLASVPFASAQVFSEDFDSLTTGTEITTANTGLSYARVGSQGGSIAALNPSSFSGTSAVITGPSGGSLNGIGATDTLPLSNVYSMGFDLKLQNIMGDIVFGAGSGDAFTGNSTFYNDEGLFWYQLENGNLHHRTGGVWVNTGGYHLGQGTAFQVHVVANGSLASVEYAGRTLASGAMDLYLNGVLTLEEVPVTNSLEADGFRIYSVDGANFEVDNINLWNSAQPIPEPETYAAVFGVFSLLTAAFLRRRRGARG